MNFKTRRIIIKRTFSIFLIIILFLSSAGYYPVFKLLQYQARQQIKGMIKTGVPEQELHEITFMKGENPDWIREGKEFRLNDQLFDIVKSRKISGGIIYQCINDKEESRLFQNLDRLVAQELANDGSAAGKSAKLIAKVFSQNYFPEEPFKIVVPESGQEEFLQIQENYKSIFRSIKTPPPRLV
ncbi:MAG: hypothetical protein K9G57_10670 [Ignavibacteriales bacterium]|nr:hypothetical protein [Ignavibacteriales bacterium]MCF8437300.1 hypothetical protein [Ignavibacteriales bacterium]